MYYSHFGLSQAPFKITPNTEFFFSGGNRGPILEALIYAITHGEGVIKVTGEVGSGKTMLCHMLPTRLPPHVETVYIANPSVSPEEILHTIAFELQLAVDRGASRLAVMQALHDYLLKRYAEGKRVVAFVEESQSMPLATLEEIRLLSNLEAKNDKLLQIVLFGQPELDDNLRQPQTRPLRERITHSFRLEPLAPGEIREYLMFRMRAAGYRGPDLFTGSVIGSIARASLGLTRRVNLIADKALLAAFSENTHTVRPKHVDAAVRDSEFSQHPHSHARTRYGWGAALVAGGAALGVAVYALLQYAVERPAPAPRATQPAPPAAAARPTPAQPAPRTAPQPAPVASAQAAAGSGKASVTLAARAQEPPRSAAPAGADLVEERLVATREWLANEHPTTYSIQLFGANDPEQLRTHLNDLAKFIEMNKVFVYRTLARQKPSLTVLYGSFGDRRAAQQALDRLPESLKANQPILRTVNGIRTEIRQHEAS
jgi:type II secretory pathway predicted ATPase ExeA